LELTARWVSRETEAHQDPLDPTDQLVTAVAQDLADLSDYLE